MSFLKDDYHQKVIHGHNEINAVKAKFQFYKNVSVVFICSILMYGIVVFNKVKFQQSSIDSLSLALQNAHSKYNIHKQHLIIVESSNQNLHDKLTSLMVSLKKLKDHINLNQKEFSMEVEGIIDFTDEMIIQQKKTLNLLNTLD